MVAMQSVPDEQFCLRGQSRTDQKIEAATLQESKETETKMFWLTLNWIKKEDSFNSHTLFEKDEHLQFVFYAELNPA